MTSTFASAAAIPLLGGVLIGLAVAVLLVTTGRVAGISGILDGLLHPNGEQRRWRAEFVAGMVLTSIAARALGEPSSSAATTGLPVLLGAGLLVGFGTRLGGGCTSGHGVCGVARASTRSIVATLIFMSVAALTVLATHHARGT